MPPTLEESVGEDLPFFRPLTQMSLQKVLSQTSKVKIKNPNKYYEEGQVLSISDMKKFNPSAMACIPLEEIDPAYDDTKTFVAIGTRGTIHRFSATPALSLISPLNPIRKNCIKISTHWGFAAFMVAVILINTILLVFDVDYGIDYVCTVIYFMELLVKVISQGVILEPFTYLRNPWNWLDILVILNGILQPFDVLTVLQWFRVLKVIPRVAEIRRASSVILKTFLRLGSTMVFATFWILFFGIFGLQLYVGVLSQKCIKNMPELDPSLVYDVDQLWFQNANKKDNWLLDSSNSDGYSLCGNFTGSGYDMIYKQTEIMRNCPDGYTCLQGFGPNPFYGYMNFDSYLWSVMTAVQIVDQDFMESTLSLLTKAVGPWHIVYFIVIFFLGTYGICTFVYAIIGQYVFETMKDIDILEETPAANNDQLETETQHDTNETPGIQNQGGYPAKCHSIVNHFAFEVLITIVIILDIISLSNIDEHYSSIVFTYVITLTIVVIVYSTEFVLKMCSLGPISYFQTWWNVLDFLILLNILFLNTLSPHVYFIPAFDFHFLTLNLTVPNLQNCPRWSTLKLTLLIICNSMKRLWGYIGLFFTFWTFLALLGKDEFQEAYLKGAKNFPGGEVPRWNFLDYPHSFLMVYRSWAGENIESVWDCLLVSGYQCFLYFPIVGIIGSMIMMTMMVGIVYVTVKTLDTLDSQTQNVSTLRRIWNICCAPFIWVSGGMKDHSPVEAIPMGSNATDRGLRDVNIVKSEIDPAISAPEGFRKQMQDWADSQVFKGISAFVIVIGSLALVFDQTNSREGETPETVTFWIDISFISIFSLISIYNLISFGLRPSLSSPGWIFDIVLITETILHLSMNLHNNSSETYTYFLLFFVRSLRPFMLITRIERLEVVIRGIFNELKFLYQFLLAGSFIWLFFVLCGVGAFGYKFYKCLHPDDGSSISGYELPEQSHCLMNNYTWENSIYHFDNVGDGFLSLMFVAVRLGWINILHDAFDSVTYDVNFHKENNLLNFNFFFIFQVCGVFFLFSILIGILYHNLKKKQFTGIFFTKSQFEEFQERGETVSVDFPIPRPETDIRGRIYELVSSPIFDAVVMIVILADNLTYTFEYYNMPYGLLETLDYIRLFILLLYTVEMILKLIAWGKFYFRSGWNRFDFLVVISSILDLIVMEFAQYFVDMRIFRPFRILRIFQFQPFRSRAKTIGVYFKAFSLVRPALWNILWFQCLLMFSYCLFGMSVFGNLKLRDGLDATNNFRGLWSSFHVLFTITSFSGFAEVLKALILMNDCDLPDSELHTPGDCGDNVTGIFFLFSYLFFSFFTILNLYLIFMMEILNQLRAGTPPVGNFRDNDSHKSNVSVVSDQPYERLQSNPNRSEIINLE